MSCREYTGINIQFPISRAITSGKKTVETRTYPLPEKYMNTELLMIETPGEEGTFTSRIVAIIKFTKSFPYKNKTAFYKDFKLHLVDKNSKWSWKNKPKFGWTVEVIKVFDHPLPMNSQKGIVFTKNIKLN